jgi:putative NADH-flavin reductase
VVAVTDRSGEDRSVIPATALSVMAAVAGTDAGKLVYIGGGGSLNAPDGGRLVDAPDFPAQYKAEALAGAEALEAFRTEAPENLDWAFLSPPPHDLHPGDKQGGYRVQGGDEPLGDPPAYAGLSSGDLASVILDEIEHPQFTRERFTAGY